MDAEEHQEIETLKTLRLDLEITQEELSRRLDLSFGPSETGKPGKNYPGLIMRQPCRANSEFR
jgi:hypothetical protein